MIQGAKCCYNDVSHMGQKQPYLISVFCTNAIILYVFHGVNKDGKY